MTQEFKEKIALVTGAASGIGRATALAFAAKGAAVIVSDVTEVGGQETVELIEESGGQAAFIKTNVAEIEEVDALINQIADTYGRLDFAVNNAGIGGRGNRMAPRAAARDRGRSLSRVRGSALALARRRWCPGASRAMIGTCPEPPPTPPRASRVWPARRSSSAARRPWTGSSMRRAGCSTAGTSTSHAARSTSATRRPR